MTQGKLITLEGAEGVGKSTNLLFIQEYLQNQKLPVIVTREPGGTVVAEIIRNILLDKNQESLSERTELLLMFAARAQHIKHVILPALEKGHWVLCDRFTDATYAYQGGGRKIEFSVISCLENFIQGDLRPDLTLLLDAPVPVGISRANKRGDPDRIEAEKIDFFEQVRKTYLKIAKQQPERVKVINANQQLHEVQTQIQVTLDYFLQ